MPRCPACHRRLVAGAPCPDDGARAPTAPATRCAPPAIPGYAVGARLGVGGFAAVWAARSAGGAAVAVKVARSASAEARRRFDAEAAALGAVGAVAPAVLDRGTCAGRPYLVLEHVDGETVAARLERARGRLSPVETRAIADGLLAALEAVHAAGWVHRDIAPDNAIVAACGAVRLVDFGAARPAASAGGDAIGTVEYAAPEQRRGASPNVRADLYAFGALLYELMTGRPPFCGDAAAVAAGHATLRPLPPGHLAPVARGVERVVLACLAKRPDDRPASAAAVRTALRRAWDDGGAARASPAASGPPAVAMQPALLVAGFARAPAAAVARAVAEAGAVLASCGRDRVLAVFVAGDDEAPAAARALAASLVDRFGARAALHLARVAVVEHGGATLVAGDAIDRPDSWLPSTSWCGVHVTDDARRAFAPSTTRVAAPLVGRGGVIEAVAAAWADPRPTLVTVLGGRGAGKTRLVHALRERLGADASIVDDAHRAPVEQLDAIELATLEDARSPAHIVVLADPLLLRRRPQWGQRAGHHAELSLEPLGDGDAAALLARALHPAEYPPQDALTQLARWAGGVPGTLVELADALRRAGAVRRTGDRWRLDVGALASLPRVAAGPWIAAQAMASLPPPLVALARLCAVMEEPLDVACVGGAQIVLERSGGAPLADASVGLAHLVELDVLVASGDGYRFASAAVRDGLRELLRDDERASLHRAALVYWRSRRPADERGLAALAHHAAACGRLRLSARVRTRLARLALAAHRPVDAEQHAEVALTSQGDPRLCAEALLVRGRARVHTDRSADAVADYRAAAALADKLGASDLVATALLDEATALDWTDDHAGATRAAARAEVVAARAMTPGLAARLALAHGRTAWRDERVADAIPWLERALAGSPDAETRIVALVVLAPALVRAGRLDDAEARFDEAIAACERAGDRLHLCAALNNRMFLWSARRDLDRARADLVRARALARELGHPMPERRATYNLAEDLHWSGDDPDEALALARRARELQLRYVATPVADEALLLARILVDRGERTEPLALLEWLGRRVPIHRRAPSARLFARAIALALADAPALAWARLCAEGRATLTGDDALDLHHAWARAALACGRTERARAALTAAAVLLPAFPIWHRRFGALAARCGLAAGAAPAPTAAAGR